jgi:uncharacterized protein YndB with AHSA1/START domain
MSRPDLGFSLKRTYPVSPERIWAHFTEPELMTRWFCPNPDLPTSCDLDPRPGGAWRVTMGEWVVGGDYVELQPPSRLVFTFDWDHDDDQPTSVTVEITPAAEGTRLVLSHEESGADGGHQEGWALSFVRLDQLLA